MTAKSDFYQVGVNASAANNFILSTDGAGGLKIQRGNVVNGVPSPTADLASFNPQGEISFSLGAFTQWTPTIFTSSGSFTSMNSAFFFKKLGKMVWYQGRINVVTNGTAAGAVSFTLPTGDLPARDSVGCGRETGVTGSMLQSIILAGAGFGAIYDYAGASPISGNGRALLVNGFYETTT